MKTIVLLVSFMFFALQITFAQAITGVWRGKVSRGIKNYNLELKLIRNGDSLTGTSYYYHSPNNYSRFKVKGYFDISGDIVWWDKELVESKGGKITNANTTPFRFAADFNCPGNDIMKLDGTAGKNEDDGKELDVHLSKVAEPFFKDEWDEIIEDFPYYASVPDYIDSVDQSIGAPLAQERVPPTPKQTPPVKEPPVAVAPKKEPPVTIAPKKEIPVLKTPKTIEEMFVERKKILVTEIPVSGDSIRLDFYDHAEIDGDSISLFLNGKMLYQHILLKASPFEFMLPLSGLNAENELIMVAENLGSIPPNTSLMIVWVNGVRHEARLESTENTSAMIRFVKQQDTSKTTSAEPRSPN